MEAVIDDPLGDVLHVYAGGSLEGPSVDDALMRYEAILAGI
jgi:hypothetical protein